MPTEVKLIAKAQDFPAALYKSLSAEGYLVDHVTLPGNDIPTASGPVVYIVDLAHLPDHSGGRWESFVTTCKQQNAVCLVYTSEGRKDPAVIRPLQPAAEFLDYPLHPDHVPARIETLLTIRKMTLEIIEARALADKRQRELQDALQSAAQVQRRLMPTELPACEHLRYAWRFMPCKRVGGDLFNVAQLDEETIMTYLMDVSGHGISSAMVSVAVHQSLSQHTGQLPKRLTNQPPFYAITPPAQVMERLEEEYPFERFDEFFSLAYLLITPRQKKVRYCCAGHPPPLLLRSDGSLERLSRGGAIIGLGGLVEFEEGEVALRSGDRLFLYTDGITEHGPPGGEAFGEAGLTAGLRRADDCPLEEAVDKLIETLQAFGGKCQLQDDVTLIGIEFTDHHPAPAGV